MIKISSKPISSPGRAEKYYPPPLMRFLRSNVGSKSRGRSRSSPMFVRSKKNTTAAIEAPEPSSPKVTCMGQVRVRRSANKKKKKRRTSADCNRCCRCRCKWIQSVLFCHGCSCRRRSRRCKAAPVCCFVRPDWGKLTRFFCCTSSKKRKPKIGEDKETDFGSSLGRRREEEEEEDGFYGGGDDEESEEEEEPTRKVFACSSPASPPPKNALLLIRSRSAPYRTSSLASRFWGSPVGNEETEQKQSTEQEEEEEESTTSLATSKRESSSCEESEKESRLYPETEEINKLGVWKSDFEGGNSVELIEERIKAVEDPEVVNDDELEMEAVVGQRPVMLTRCKSEPARIGGEKFDAEVSFWKKRRLGFT